MQFQTIDSQINKTKNNCLFCKKQIDIGDNYCRHCGGNLKQPSLSKNPSQNDLNTIIDCVKNMPFEAGINYTTKILKGSKSILKNGNKPSDFMHYGSLFNHTMDKIKTYLDYLVSEGILAVYESGNFGNIKVKIGDLNLQNDTTKISVEDELGDLNKKKQKTKTNAAGEPWSDLLDQELEFLYAKQMSIIDLMAHFERSRGGITARLKRLGLME